MDTKFDLLRKWGATVRVGLSNGLGKENTRVRMGSTFLTAFTLYCKVLPNRKPILVVVSCGSVEGQVMELREALVQIAEIRRQMAQGQIFRGYRAASTAFTGLVALVNGLLLSAVFPVPVLSERPEYAGEIANWHRLFVIAWAAAAALCMVVVGVEMVIRTRRSNSDVQRQLTLLAVEQFMPTVVAGGLLTWVFMDFLPQHIWMLPGLWMILFSLGVFASARLLPRAVFGVGAFYLLAGIATMILMPAGHPNLMNLYMGAAFGCGQLALAAILYFKLEKVHE